MPTQIIGCCVKNCVAVGVPNHRFPKPERERERFNRWLDILGIEELRLLDPVKVYRNKRVCSAHFAAKYRDAGNRRLRRNAIPFVLLVPMEAAVSPRRLSPIPAPLDVVTPRRLSPMRVKYAVQVFSQRVAALMRHLARKNEINPKAEETAQIFLFLDKLFDSLNSSSRNAEEEKPLRGLLSDTSPHVSFWNEALKVVDSMKYVASPKDIKVPSIINFKKTINGIILIWTKLKACGITKLNLRNFNQDPLENDFGMVRSQGMRNTNPSCSQFIATFKTLTINNLMGTRSIGANCEEDVTEGVLSTLTELLVRQEDAAIEESEEFEMPINSDVNEDGVTLQNSNYNTGKIIKLLKEHMSPCEVCKADLHAVQVGIQHELMMEHGDPIFPSYSAVTAFINIRKLAINILKFNIEKKKIVKNIKLIINEKVYFDFLSCVEHKKIIQDNIVHNTVQLVVTEYIKNINNILCGKVKLNADEITDELKRKAQERYDKYNNFKKKSKF